MPSGGLSGGNATELVAAQVQALVIEPLMAESVVLAAGPRMFTTSGGAPIRIPKLIQYSIGTGTAASATYWIGENVQIPETPEPDFGEVVLLPSTLKSVKVLHRFSNELARHSVVDIANVLRDSIVRRVQLALDAIFIAGTGAASTPTGILNMAGTTTANMAGATPTIDELHDANRAALVANANPDVWLISPTNFTALAKQREAAGSGQYLLQPDPSQPNTMRLLGIRALVTNQMPDTHIVLADMSQIAVGRDLDASVTLLSERYADYDQMAIRVVSRWDIQPLNAAGIVVMS